MYILTIALLARETGVKGAFTQKYTVMYCTNKIATAFELAIADNLRTFLYFTNNLPLH